MCDNQCFAYFDINTVNIVYNKKAQYEIEAILANNNGMVTSGTRNKRNRM